jgi:signal transduction histidine kinase
MMKISLRTLLIVPFLLQVMGITGLVIYLSYRSGQRVIETMTEQMVAKTAEGVTQQLNDYFQTPVLLTHQYQAAIAAGWLTWSDLAAMETYFIDQAKAHPTLSALMMVTENQQFLAVEQFPSGEGGLAGPPQTSRATTGEPPWYSLAQGEPDGLWLPTFPLGEAAGEAAPHPPLAMTYLLPFTDPDGEPRGVLGTSVSLDQVGRFLHRLGVGQTGQVFLVDGQGYVLATSNTAYPWRQTRPFSPSSPWTPQDWLVPIADSPDPVIRQVPQLERLAAEGGTQGRFQFRLNGDRYAGQIVPFRHPQLPWQVVVIIPQRDFIAVTTRDLLHTLILCALALLGTIGLGIWTAQYITKPILSLQQATQAFADGMAVVPPTQPTPIVEVEALRQHFDHMVLQLVTSFRALRDRETTLATFLNGIPIAISVHDPTGQVLFLNQKGKELLVEQSPPHPAPATPAHLSETYRLYVAGTDQLYPADQLPVVRGLRGESTYTDDIEIDTGHQRIPLEIHAIPVFDAEGQVLYSINTFQDIAERRRAEQLQAYYERDLEQRVAQQMASLAENEMTKQALINAIPDLLIRVGQAGIPLEIYNLDAIKWLGDPAQIYQQNVFDNLPEAIAQERKAGIERALTTGTLQLQEYEFEINGQTYCEEARIVPVTQNEVLMVVRDISDRRKVERLKDEFISIVSHELRTPLTAIRGSLGILEAGILHNRPEKATAMLQIALTNTERLIRLVNDILDLEQLAAGQMYGKREPCAVASLMRLAVDGVEALALAAHIHLTLEPIDQLVWANADAVVQTLTNLLSNAIKFSDPYSTVGLRAEVNRMLPQSPPITPAFVKKHHPQAATGIAATPHAVTDPGRLAQVRFSVSDQGRGIPTDRLDSIFERFQQVDASDSRQKGGTGLGLAICKRIVEHHGGEIWVESRLGQGSTFYFTLPTCSPVMVSRDDETSSRD